MSKTLVGISAASFLLVSAALAPAADVTAKKILIKDNADVTKRQIMVLSKDLGVTYAGADTPGAGGASVHVYSATDAYCAILAPGANWQDLGTKWKYKDITTKNVAQIKDGKLLVRIKEDALTYSLDEPLGQGAVNVQVQFGTGTRYCMRCGGTIVKDDAVKFFAKDCAVAACDVEPGSCDPPNPTTTSSSTSSTTSTTGTTLASVLKAVLPAATGRFNYAGLGLPGADIECNNRAAGTTHCTYAELQAAETAGDLDGIMAVDGTTVTSFWAIDNSASVQVQCINDQMGGSFLNWEYQTAHTGTGGSRVALTNPTGVLGPLQTGIANAPCTGSNWVGCCP